MVNKKPNFAKGPWRVFDYFEYEVDGSDGLLICNCDIPARKDSERKANAQLISAAPELYEALVGAYEALCDLSDSDWRDRDFNLMKKCLAAIRKANGEEQ